MQTLLEYAPWIVFGLVYKFGGGIYPATAALMIVMTLLLPGDELPLTDGREIRKRLEHQVDCVLDGGHCGIEPTTVVDLAVTPPTVTRIGRGSLETLGI